MRGPLCRTGLLEVPEACMVDYMAGVAPYQAIFEGEGTDNKSTPHCFTLCLFLQRTHITVRCWIA